MRVLLDTNIIIYREDNRVMSENLQQVLNLMATHSVSVLVHPLAIVELNRDKDSERRAIIQSKIRSYPMLDSPPDPEIDSTFRDLIPRKESEHHVVDDNLLYMVYRDAIDILLTNDGEIKDKALKLGLQDRVFSTEELLVLLRRQFKTFDATVAPVSIRYLPLHNLSLADPIFDQLKEEYAEFSDWFRRKSLAGEKAWVYFREDQSIGAFLLLKKEDEPVSMQPQPLPKVPRVKIATLKVDQKGYKLGELFIKIAVEYAVSNELDELYLTHFAKPQDDYLIRLISEFGFDLAGTNDRGEQVYVKQLRPANSPVFSQEFSHRYYPSFFDAPDRNKFIIPIAPDYHKRLFPELNTEPSLFVEGLIAEGNSIKKAYLCHAMTKQIKPRDIVLFYRSGDQKAITTLGVVEKIFLNQTSWTDAVRLTNKRTVYSEAELKDILGTKTLILLFWWHFHMPSPVRYAQMKKLSVLTGPPQSIMKVSNEQYLTIKRLGGLNERYTFN